MEETLETEDGTAPEANVDDVGEVQRFAEQQEIRDQQWRGGSCFVNLSKYVEETGDGLLVESVAGQRGAVDLAAEVFDARQPYSERVDGAGVAMEPHHHAEVVLGDRVVR